MPITVLPPKQRVRQLLSLLAEAELQPQGASLTVADGTNMELPNELLTLLDFVLKAWIQERSVTVLVNSEMLTTQEAANWIGCSRQHVVSLMNSGQLPGRKIGTHRRIQIEDVLSFIREEKDALTAGQ